MSDDSLRHPPRPDRAFRVGVVGHRSDRLRHANLALLEQTIGDILSAISESVKVCFEKNAEFFSSSPIRMYGITPLADGTDQMFARRAHDQGYTLQCPLPFHREEYRKDFSGDSLAEFDRLLAEAETVFELDGVRKPPQDSDPEEESADIFDSKRNEENAYGTCGRVVLNHSDIVIVVWDGENRGRWGGTEEMLEVLRGRYIPVILINAQAPHGWCAVKADNKARIIAPPKVPGEVSILQKVISQTLLLPSIEKGENEACSGRKRVRFTTPHKELQAFMKERRPWFNFGFTWSLFRSFVGGRGWPSFQIFSQKFDEIVTPEWPRDRSTLRAALVDDLRPFYAWPDQLSVLYSNRYRGAYILSYLLAAASVALALLPLWNSLCGRGPDAEGAVNLVGSVASMGEIVLVVVLLLLFFLGHMGRWHERWIRYRMLAELIRQFRLVVPVGGERPIPKMPAHFTAYGLPSSTWMAWYARAVDRATGLPAAIVDSAYLSGCLSHLEQVIDGQISFHQRNSEMCRKIIFRLGILGVVLLIITLVSCAVQLSDFWIHFISRSSACPGCIPPIPLLNWNNILMFLSGFFPALGAASAGLINHGEFRRLAKRSEAMEAELVHVKNEEISKIYNEIKRSSQVSDEVGLITTRTVKLMMSEVLDWRVTFLDRPLEANL